MLNKQGGEASYKELEGCTGVVRRLEELQQRGRRQWHCQSDEAVAHPVHHGRWQLPPAAGPAQPSCLQSMSVASVPRTGTCLGLANAMSDWQVVAAPETWHCRLRIKAALNPGRTHADMVESRVYCQDLPLVHKHRNV